MRRKTDHYYDWQREIAARAPVSMRYRRWKLRRASNLAEAEK
jgi:hypothetical protein